MRRFLILFAGFLVILGLLFLLGSVPVAVTQAAEPVQLIRNDHAMGLAGDICPQTHDPYAEAAGAGWDYSPEMSLSKCGNKNSDAGAMFKNGPVAFSGNGLPGVPATMWQDYDMASLGFTGGSIQFDFEVELISMGGTAFHAYLYSSADGVTFSNPVDLLDWPNGNVGQGSKFPVYAGSQVLPYAPFYRLEIVSVWQSGIGSLGQKWANLSLLATGDIVPTQTPTSTPLPTETPTATPTSTPVSYTPLLLSPGAWQLECAGQLTINGIFAICED